MLDQQVLYMEERMQEILPDDYNQEVYRLSKIEVEGAKSCYDCMRMILDDKGPELLKQAESQAVELYKARTQHKQDQIQLKQEKKIEKEKEIAAKKHAEYIENTTEFLKSGAYLLGEYKTLARVLNDVSEFTYHTKLIDTSSTYLKYAVSFLHAGFSTSYAYFAANTVPLVNTVIFSLRENTNLLKSDNAFIQCGIDMASSSISYIATFNPHGAIAAATLAVG